jgi:hypothetical protein
MRTTSLAKLLLALSGLLILGIAPAGAAESLVITCKVCDEAITTGKGLPANQAVRLTLVDVKTGQQVVAPLSVTTDADGSFVKKVPVNLYDHPALEASVWTEQGGTLVVAAHSRLNAPCKRSETLSFTGSHTPQLLVLGLGLLAVGALLVGGTRQRRPHPQAH